MENDLQFERARIGLFLFWVVLTFAMVFGAQISGDQLNLLARGFLLSEYGELVPYGNPMSGGGKAPGALTSLVVGVPMMLWNSHLAPQLLLWATQVVAYPLLDAVLRTCALTPLARLLFCILFLLTPAHTYFSVFLWNPNYLYLVAAMHLWTLYRLHKSPSLVMSVLHVVVLGVGMQLHASTMILGVTTVLLWWFRVVRVNYLGVALGSVLVGASLVPWLVEVMQNPSLAPAAKEKKFIGRGLLYVYPMLRGVLYSLELPSWMPFWNFAKVDFTPVLGAGVDRFLTPLMKTLMYAVGVITLIPSILSYRWLYLRAKAWYAGEQLPWLQAVVLAGHAGALVSFALSPTTIHSWQVVVASHLCALRVVYFLADTTTWWLPRVARLPLPAITVVGVLIMLTVGFATPQYRYGGRGGLGLPLRNTHPMLEKLRLTELFELIPYQDGYGWWMDVLPDAHSPAGGPDAWRGKPWEDPQWREHGTPLK